MKDDTQNEVGSEKIGACADFGVELKGMHETPAEILERHFPLVCSDWRWHSADKLPQKKRELTQGWREWILNRAEHGYIAMMTLPVHVALPDRVSFNLANRVIKRMNSLLFGRDGYKDGLWLNGFYVAEQNRTSRFRRGCLHWHFLIEHPKSASLFDLQSLEAVLKNAISSVSKGPPHRALSLSKKSIVPVTSDEQVIGYTQKELRSNDCEDGDQFGVLDQYGMSAFGLNDDRKSLQG
jgi:hypothetical protein